MFVCTPAELYNITYIDVGKGVDICIDNVIRYFPVARHLNESNTAGLAGKVPIVTVFIVVNNNCVAEVGAAPNVRKNLLNVSPLNTLMIPFIYKYMPSSVDEFELDSKSSLSYQTNVLLLGPERSGKTTLASLLVKDIDPDQVLFINVLKEQGIQYYRNEVKTFCQSTTNKKIIVDGLDEMNEQTQQIFLNYMETYAGIQFIVTGSNPQKIMESIYSTCMVIRLKPVSDAYLHAFVDRVCAEENIHADPAAKEYLVSLTRPSIRSMLNYLEKYKILGIPLTVAHLQQTNTDIPFTLLETFFNAVQRGDKKEAQCILSLYNDGYSVMDTLDACYEYVKVSTMPDLSKYKYIKIICKYIAIFNMIHEHPLELFFFLEDCINISSDSRN